jgi:hypothetical protein
MGLAFANKERRAASGSAGGGTTLARAESGLLPLQHGLQAWRWFCGVVLIGLEGAEDEAFEAPCEAFKELGGVMSSSSSESASTAGA